MQMRTLLIAGGLLASLAATPVAASAQSGTYHYDVTVKAEMKDQWSFREEGDIGTPVGPVPRHPGRRGLGLVAAQEPPPDPRHGHEGLRRPPADAERRHGGGRPADRRVQADRQHVRPTPSAKCESANPPIVATRRGAGTKSAGFSWNLAWKDNSAGSVYPSASRRAVGGLPVGPGSIEWRNDESPSLMDVTADGERARSSSARSSSRSGGARRSRAPFPRA
jgi:hypothetical protein